jgi:hypothetical protein
MRVFALAAAASFAVATGAYAQSLFEPLSGPRNARAQALLQNQSAQMPTDISRLCGVTYAINDPDPTIRFELRRDCISGIDGGGD